MVTNPNLSTLVKLVVDKYYPGDGMTKGEMIDYYMNRAREMETELTETELENLYQAFDHYVDELFNY